MDIQLEKYKLLEWLIGLKDEKIILKIKDIKSQNDIVVANTVSEAEELFIRAGLKDIEEGNTFTHNQVMGEISKAYGL